MIETLESWIATADAWLWGPPLLIMLFGTHVFYTFRLHFIQRHLLKGFRLIVAKDDSVSGNVSPLNALAVALASTIGTGNIVGVATAISMGGPGAVFWCMMTGLFGMATKYAESMLAVKYRVKDETGEVHGGPMVTIAEGMKCKWLAVAFAAIAAIAVFGTGNLVQSNAISTVVTRTLAVPTWATGIALAVIFGLVIMGGLQSIAKVCTAFVPIMGAAYLGGCAVLLFVFNHAVLWDSIVLIVESAFSAKAMAGAVGGYGVMMALRYGMARGLFSNEAGMGSEPIVAATAQTRNAVRQGLVSYAGTFCTIIICALTGLAIVSSLVATQGTTDAISIKSELLSQECFALIPVCGKYILAFALFAFASTTVIGWYYYGEQCIRFLWKSRKAIWLYKCAYILMTFLGSIGSLNIVWNFSDLANGVMVIPNIISLLCLNKVVVAETRKYLWNKKLEDFDPDLAK